MWKIAFAAVSCAAALFAASPASAQAGAIRAATEAARMSDEAARAGSRASRALVTVVRQGDMVEAAAHAQRHVRQSSSMTDLTIDGGQNADRRPRRRAD